MIAWLWSRVRCYFGHSADLVADGEPEPTHRGLVQPMVCLRCGERWGIPYYGGLT